MRCWLVPYLILKEISGALIIISIIPIILINIHNSAVLMQHQFATSNVAASNDVYLSSYACTIHNWIKGLKSQVMANCFKASRSPHSSLLKAEPDAVGAPSLPSGQRFWRLARALSASVLCWMSLGHFLLAAPKSTASPCDPRATPPVLLTWLAGHLFTQPCVAAGILRYRV